MFFKKDIYEFMVLSLELEEYNQPIHQVLRFLKKLIEEKDDINSLFKFNFHLKNFLNLVEKAYNKFATMDEAKEVFNEISVYLNSYLSKKRSVLYTQDFDIQVLYLFKHISGFNCYDQFLFGQNKKNSLDKYSCRDAKQFFENITYFQFFFGNPLTFLTVLNNNRLFDFFINNMLEEKSYSNEKERHKAFYETLKNRIRDDFKLEKFMVDLTFDSFKKKISKVSSSETMLSDLMKYNKSMKANQAMGILQDILLTQYDKIFLFNEIDSVVRSFYREKGIKETLPRDIVQLILHFTKSSSDKVNLGLFQEKNHVNVSTINKPLSIIKEEGSYKAFFESSKFSTEWLNPDKLVCYESRLFKYTPKLVTKKYMFMVASPNSVDDSFFVDDEIMELIEIDFKPKIYNQLIEQQVSSSQEYLNSFNELLKRVKREPENRQQIEKTLIYMEDNFLYFHQFYIKKQLEKINKAKVQNEQSFNSSVVFRLYNVNAEKIIDLFERIQNYPCLENQDLLNRKEGILKKLYDHMLTYLIKKVELEHDSALKKNQYFTAIDTNQICLFMKLSLALKGYDEAFDRVYKFLAFTVSDNTQNAYQRFQKAFNFNTPLLDYYKPGFIDLVEQAYKEDKVLSDDEIKETFSKICTLFRKYIEEDETRKDLNLRLLYLVERISGKNKNRKSDENLIISSREYILEESDDGAALFFKNITYLRYFFGPSWTFLTVLNNNRLFDFFINNMLEEKSSSNEEERHKAFYETLKNRIEDNFQLEQSVVDSSFKGVEEKSKLVSKTNKEKNALSYLTQCLNKRRENITKLIRRHQALGVLQDMLLAQFDQTILVNKVNCLIQGVIKKWWGKLFTNDATQIIEKHLVTLSSNRKVNLGLVPKENHDKHFVNRFPSMKYSPLRIFSIIKKGGKYQIFLQCSDANLDYLGFKYSPVTKSEMLSFIDPSFDPSFNAVPISLDDKDKTTYLMLTLTEKEYNQRIEPQAFINKLVVPPLS